MLTTFRAKLTAIVGVAGLALVVLIGVSSALSSRVASQLSTIQQQYVPKLELGPRLEAEFDRLRRSVQDAVAARDGDALDESHGEYAALIEHLSLARGVLAAGDASALEAALDDYYRSLIDVSNRMINGETGEQLVAAMSAMQAKQSHTSLLLKKVTTFDRAELGQVFAEAAHAQETAGKVRLLVSLGCLLFVISLSLWLSREVLRALAELSRGLERVGRGDFEQPIIVQGDDELADVARRANAMAENLRRLQTERERADWLRAGRAGLTEELGGELSPEDLAQRAVRFVARYLAAPVGALYYLEHAETLRLAGEYGLAEVPIQEAPTFRIGEGLLGQACLEAELTVLHEPPAGFLRARSGLGESTLTALVFLPLEHAGKVIGVLELGLFGAWSDRCAELLTAISAPLAVAIEVARARAAMSQLLEQTQRQAERLTVQEEELQATNEVLHTQQEELRQTNEELTLQTTELETQQHALREKNSELDEASQHLRQKAEELTKISTYKSQFLANMSHELRTPLNSMLLLSNLLADNDDSNLTEKQVQFCKTIHSAGKDLLALINQVLDLAKVEAGKQELRIESVELARWVDYAERVFRPLANEKSLALRIELDPELPPSIETDPQRVQQVLNNLLANAIKFTQRGGVTLEIRRPTEGVAFRRADLHPERAIALAVTDTGVGIAMEHQERIFAPFEQVEAASDRRFGGTGLGLTIARELSHLLGGELELTSVAGQGSTFICYLPFEPPPKTAATDSKPPALAALAPRAVRATRRGASPVRKPAATPAEEHRPYLLVVEDDATFGQIFGDVICRQGLDFELVPSGRAALELCRKRPPSGIILDVKLPDLDGWEVMEALRSDPLTAGIPVHFVSAAAGAERALEMGAIGYLTKPATRQDLSRVVQALAERSSEPNRRILVVEHAADPGDSLVQQLLAEHFEVTRATTAKEALAVLPDERFVCVILDLALPDMSGLDLLRALREQCGPQAPAVVAYSTRPLSKAEAKSLEAYAEAIVLKEGSSNERLLDEVQLFVRRLKSGIRPKSLGLANALPLNVRLEGKRVLIVDDDMRTVYALSATLRAKGADVLVADTGHAALGVLAQPAHVDAVLMDIMMPELDGYETMRRIRQDHRLDTLPIIALTAKAMKGDRDRCLEVGASDYLPKPIDPERLLAMLHERLKDKPQSGGEGGHAS